MRKFILVGVVALCSVLVTSCGAKSAAAGCTDLCKAAGHSSGTAKTEANEVNCTCQGGTDSLSDAACTQMCKDIGKTSGMTYAPSSGTKIACQCT